MQTAEDVQREVIQAITIYLSWFTDITVSWAGEDHVTLWAKRVSAPYVCQRGSVFEIGTLPTRRDAMRITHSEHSVLTWYTMCRFHERDRRGRFMGCTAHPLYRPDLLAAYRLAGIDAIGTKSSVRNVICPASPDARPRYVEKPTHRAQYQEMLYDEWRRRVARALKGFKFDGNP